MLTATVSAGFFFFSIFESVCVIVGNCDPGDTFCNGNFHRSTFEYFARSFYLCPWTICQRDIVTLAQGRYETLWVCSRIKIKVKFKDGHGLTLEY